MFKVFPKEVQSDTKSRFCYVYVMFNYGFGLPTLDSVTNVYYIMLKTMLKNTIFKLLAVKTTIEKETLSQYLYCTPIYCTNSCYK